MLLAQMGADVIKVESLEGDSFRHFGFGFLGWNQGSAAWRSISPRPRAATSSSAWWTVPISWSRICALIA